MTEIRIHFEGDKSLRAGFKKFLAQIVIAAATKRIRVLPIPGKATAEADFYSAQRTFPQAWNILLRDSEGPDAPEQDSIFYMVELMEAWFLADQDNLERYYGDGFARNALKKNPHVEQIPKTDVMDCLKRATKDAVKGTYNKTAHAPRILELLDPIKVRTAAPNCERLFREVLARINP